MYKLIGENNLPPKIDIKVKNVPIVTNFFNWENATLIDPIFGLDKIYY
jgi:hypothetical protein